MKDEIMMQAQVQVIANQLAESLGVKEVATCKITDRENKVPFGYEPGIILVCAFSLEGYSSTFQVVGAMTDDGFEAWIVDQDHGFQIDPNPPGHTYLCGAVQPPLREIKDAIVIPFAYKMVMGATPERYQAWIARCRAAFKLKIEEEPNA